MLYVLDWEEISFLSLSAQEGLRKGHRKLQVSKGSRFLQKQKAMIMDSRERIFVK
jgi:hypothetical protein